MRLRRLISLLAVMVIAVASSSVLAATLQHQTVKDKSDPISGEWEVVFELQGTTVPGKFKLKLDGDKVSGTVESEHTGSGTLSKGSWGDNKIGFTLDFAAHESIVVTGKLEDGKLIGEFRTEGMQGKWEAKRK
jgi:hypothetical protein